MSLTKIAGALAVAGAVTFAAMGFRARPQRSTM